MPATYGPSSKRAAASGRRGQAACRLALRGVELEPAPVEAREERRLARQLVIDTAGEDVVGGDAVDGRRVVVEVAGAVRQRIDAGDVLPDTVLALGRNDVVGIGIAQELRVRRADRPGRIERRIGPRGQRIVNGDQVAVGVPEVAEIAGARHRRRHRIDEHLTALFVQPRVVGEEERAVVTVVQPGKHQRTADRAAELMTIQRRLRILHQAAVGLRHLAHEEVARVEGVVPHVLEHGAVQQVAARLGRDRDHARPAAEFRREHPRQHLELAHLLDRRRDDHGIERVFVVVDPVDQPGVRVGLVSECVEVRGPAGIERAGPRQVLVGLPRRDSRRQVDQRREVAAVQRQLLDRPLLDDRPDLGRVRPEQRRFGHDRRGLLDAAHLERHVDTRALVDLQDHALPAPAAEALHVHLDRVGSGRQERRGVAARLVGDVAVGGPLVDLPNRDGCARDDAVLVLDGADDGTGGDLGGGWRDAHRQESKEGRKQPGALKHDSPREAEKRCRGRACHQARRLSTAVGGSPFAAITQGGFRLQAEGEGGRHAHPLPFRHSVPSWQDGPASWLGSNDSRLSSRATGEGEKGRNSESQSAVTRAGRPACGRRVQR